MASFVLASSPITGHAGPIIQVAADLVARGHRVAVVGGSRFARGVLAAGAEFLPLPGLADFDDRDQDSYIPDRARYSGIRRAQYEIRSIFVAPIPDQARALRLAIERCAPDAVLVDGAFLGALPLLAPALPAPTRRPPILALGVTPLSRSGAGLAPYGMGLPPAESLPERAKFAAMRWVARRVLFRSTQRAAQKAVARAGGRLTSFAMDCAGEFDGFLQTGPEGLEYPRAHLPERIRFVGVLPAATSDTALPAWWSDLDVDRPVVHVTQGTIDNHDFSRLVRPTIEALAGRECLLVVTGGGRSVAELGPLPDNVRAADFLPYDRLLPKIDAFVTNGGYGGVQAAVAHGVPIVVAGDTEEKPEVAARVAWSGAGIDLRTGSPSVAALREAVDAALDIPLYAAAARRLAAEVAGHRTLDEIESALLAAAAAR